MGILPIFHLWDVNGGREGVYVGFKVGVGKDIQDIMKVKVMILFPFLFPLSVGKPAF